MFVRRMCLLLLSAILVFFSFGFDAKFVVWEKSGQGIYESDIRSLAVDSHNRNVIYAGTSKALYKSVDGGKYYQSVLRVQGEATNVNFIYLPPEDNSVTIFCATDAGLFLSRDAGATWQRIFYDSNMLARRCLSVVQVGSSLYLGTQRGLFRKDVGESGWHQVKQLLDNDPIEHLVADNEFIYIANDQTLFCVNRQTDVMRQCFTLGAKITIEDNGANDFVTEQNQNTTFTIKFLHISPASPQSIFLASSDGIYQSFDQAKEWRRLSDNNISLQDVTGLFVASISPLRLMAATTRGVLVLQKDRWIPVYKGMETNRISVVVGNANGKIYAATDQGVFYSDIYQKAASAMNVLSWEQLQTNFDHEPQINKVHQWAIEYAEVNNQKIKEWRHLSKKRAWFPKVTMGADVNKNRTTSDTLWGSYSSGGQHYQGPDDKTFYSNFGADVSVTWDFADLIWSTDQTTIDSRSKSMVELREDILNQVTRLYFERRRVQMELLSSTLATGVEDPRLNIDKTMRVYELTALIDALTGGEFSRILKGSVRNNMKEK